MLCNCIVSKSIDFQSLTKLDGIVTYYLTSNEAGGDTSSVCDPHARTHAHDQYV